MEPLVVALWTRLSAVDIGLPVKTGTASSRCALAHGSWP
jgi:hypothetical protein